ncbi:MAG: AraC family transcriptional regulator ligand-binding domain-containing protein [Pseudomonadota bacterium]
MRDTDRTEDDNLGATHIDIPSATVSFALSQGMTMAEIETATGLHGPSLGDPAARLPADIPPRLWQALEGRSDGSVALTVEAARSLPLSALGGLVHGLQYAAVLHDALEFMMRHSRVLADRLKLNIQSGSTETAFIGAHPADAIDGGRMSEVGMFLMIRVVREVLQQRRAIRRIEIAGSPLGPISDYANFLRVPVAFDKPRRQIIFDTQALDTPVPGGNAALFAFADRHFAALRRRIDAQSQVPAFLRLARAIADGGASGDYRVSAAVIRADMSPRAAQRVAARAGTSLQDMIEEARRANAEAFLSDPTITIETVATMLGYSDDRAFRRAFKRWTGTSPSDYRATYR